jgi:hypothetical protein
MAKGSSARAGRQPARTATSEEVAKETGATMEPVSAAVPPTPDPAFAASVKEVRDLDDLAPHLSDCSWAPSTPAEIAAALQTLAQTIDYIWDVECASDPSLHTLRKHVLALESLIVGRDVLHLASLDEDPSYSLAGRAEFQRLYQRFEEQRKAGEDAGLHQRLREAEARIVQLERRLMPGDDLANAVDEIINGDRIEDRLLNKGWLPVSPAEVAATLLEMASTVKDAHKLIGAMDDVGGNTYWAMAPGVSPSLRDHVRALEASVYGAPHDDGKDAQADRRLIAISQRGPVSPEAARA